MHRSVELETMARAAAAEARIMRRLEQKRRMSARYAREGGWPDGRMADDRQTLHHARTVVVRRMARAVHLARMFVKGVEYRRVEQKLRGPIPGSVVDEVTDLLDRFGPSEYRNATRSAREMELIGWLSNG